MENFTDSLSMHN